MRHTILTRFKFEDKSLLRKYLKVSKDVFIKSLKEQTDQAFELVLMVMPEDIEMLRRELDFPFIPITKGIQEYVDFTKNNNIEIQTRHDCDDWMAPNYIATIHKLYRENIKKHEKFLIQSQATKWIYPNGPETSIAKYTDTRCSMHLTLCQRTSTNHIFEHQHAKMYNVTSNIISLPEGYTRWVIHGENITLNRHKRK